MANVKYKMLFTEDNKMISRDDVSAVFVKLCEMERKHARDYWSARDEMDHETDMKMRQSLLECCLVDQAHLEGIQYAQGLIMDMMKQKDEWIGSKAQEVNEAQKKWQAEQYKKHMVGE